MYKKGFCLTALATFSLVSAHGATLVWNFTDLNGAVDLVDGSPVVPVGVGSFSIANSFGTVATPISTTSASTGYAGASGTGNIGTAVNNASFSTATSPYLSVTLTPTATDSVVISNFDFGTRSTGTGATLYSLRSSVDGFATEIFPGTNLANSTWTLKDNTISTAVTGATGAAVEVRLYVFGGTAAAASGTINTRVDDISITATGFNSDPVPEPSTAISLLGGLGVLCGFRRIRGSRRA